MRVWNPRHLRLSLRLSLRLLFSSRAFEFDSESGFATLLQLFILQQKILDSCVTFFANKTFFFRSLPKKKLTAPNRYVSQYFSGLSKKK